MKLLARAPMSEERLEELRDMFDEVIYDPWNATGERYYEDEMLKVLQEVKPDVLITELDKVTEKVVSNYKGLKVIGDCRAKPANIEVDACTKAGIPILCTPARNAQAVAEMLVGTLLCYMRKVIPANKWLLDGKWVEGTTPYFTWMGNELSKKKVGFVGFGAVAKATARILEAFDCEISYYDPFVEYDKFNKCELEEIFKNNEIVSVHLPVLDTTKNMIGKDLLSLMNKDAIFVNTSRSAVVVADDLIDALKNKSIKGAVVDVFDSEPPKAEDLQLAKLDNVLLTPHICGATYEVTNHQSDIITEKLKKWLNKEDLDKIIYNKI